MDRAAEYARKAVIAVYLVGIHALLFYLIITGIVDKYDKSSEAGVPVVAETEVTPAKTDSVESEAAPVPSASVTAPLSTPVALPTSRPGGLIVPVAGVRADQLVDSFSDARSEGRVHDAIDILAPGGTPVVAAADGEIVKFFDSKAGGITIYQSSSDKRYMYYYAHLQARAADLREGDFVKQGRTIGYVGDTGNAGAGNYHLHFSVASVTDPKRYWEGAYLNPFILLRH